MGKSFSLLSICSGDTEDSSPQSKTEFQVHNYQKTDDSIISPKGYNYFTSEEQKRYTLLLKDEKQSILVVETPRNWLVSEVLGEGSFGKVMLAANMDSGDLMAVKQIPVAGLPFQTANERLRKVQKEVEILSQLNHKNIVRYLGTQRTQEYLYIFLEYIAGGSIASLLQKYGKLNENLIKVYTKQVLEGLEYLHSHNIIHRDIKGANVLVGKNGVCKVADFGAAKRILENKGQLRSLKGTINWMAPEVMKQEGHGRFADIWSLGCLVVEMATGKPPWHYKTNPVSVFMHVCNTEELPRLPDLSSEAKDFIFSCFRREPTERPNVCKLLKHRFIKSENPAPLVDFEGETIRSEKVYNERLEAEEQENLNPLQPEGLNPLQKLQGPFGSILSLSNVNVKAKPTMEDFVLRRPSSSSESE